MMVCMYVMCLEISLCNIMTIDLNLPHLYLSNTSYRQIFL